MPTESNNQSVEESVEARTGALRFLERRGKRILQEEWISPWRHFWKDVPCVKEE